MNLVWAMDGSCLGLLGGDLSTGSFTGFEGRFLAGLFYAAEFLLGLTFGLANLIRGCTRLLGLLFGSAHSLSFLHHLAPGFTEPVFRTSSIYRRHRFRLHHVLVKNENSDGSGDGDAYSEPELSAVRIPLLLSLILSAMNDDCQNDDNDNHQNENDKCLIEHAVRHGF